MSKSLETDEVNYDYSFKRSKVFELDELDVTEDNLTELPIYYRNGKTYHLTENEIIIAKSLFGGGHNIPDSKMIKSLYRQIGKSKTEKEIWEKYYEILDKINNVSEETRLKTRIEKAMKHTDTTKCMGKYNGINGNCVTSSLKPTNSRQIKTLCLYCKENCAKKVFGLENLDEFTDRVSKSINCDCVECNFTW